MKPFFILFVLLSFSCAQRKELTLGSSSVEELKAIEGEPLVTQNVPNSQAKIFQYENDLKYQVKDELVIARFRQPFLDKERYLVYWQNKFKNCNYELIKHPSLEVELRCKSEGQSVFYLNESKNILRIVEYEKN